MIEPISMSLIGALLFRSVAHEGLLGKAFEELFGKNANKVADHILHSLGDALKSGHLPANHDLRRAGLDSIRKAGLVLADAVMCELDPRLIKDSWTFRLQRRFLVANWLSAGAGPEMAWVQRLVDALKDEAKLKILDDSFLQVGANTTELLQGTVDVALATNLQVKFAEWVAQQVDSIGKPPFFDRFLSDGWPVDQGTLALFQAYCLFFREHLKHDPTVFNIFTGSALTEIKSELHKLSAGRAVEIEEITKRVRDQSSDSLAVQLGEHRVWLEGQFNQVFEQFRQLAPSIPPFVAVQDATDQFGKDDDGGAYFKPSRREYEQNRVHRPSLADVVAEKLKRERFACVLGKGASGKTTLALLLAYSHPFGPDISYYYDLAGVDDNDDDAERFRLAIGAISRRHNGQALVIVDNIHLAERLARNIYLHGWRDAGCPVHLLLLGRFTEKGPDRRGGQSALADLKKETLELIVEGRDLLGVLHRLAHRTKSRPNIPLAPPDETLKNWLKIFEGELVAFSIAVRYRWKSLLNGHYELTAGDAATYVRREYLENKQHPVTTHEKEDLIALAACAELELGVPAEGLPFSGGLETSIHRGLVLVSTYGEFGEFRYYRFVHPGMGELLWTAACPSRSQIEYLCEIAQRSLKFSFSLARRLIKHDEAAAKRVLVAAVSRQDAFEDLIRWGLAPCRKRCLLLLRTQVITPAGLDDRLRQCNNLTQSALGTPLSHLANFLKYAQTNLPKVWRVLADVLAKEENRQSLAQSALGTPLNDLANFLEYAQTNLPKVWQALADVLAKEENRQTLVQAALATPLHDLASFLNYAQTKLPTVWQALATELERAPNASAAGQTALVIGSANLSGFLAYAACALPNLAKSVNETLAADFRAQGIGHPRLQSALRGSATLYELEAIFAGCGYLALVEEKARVLIRENTPVAWKDKSGGFGLVVTLLRLGRSADEQDIQRFLKTTATTEWLQTNYHKLPPEIIAIGLYTLWAWTPDFVQKHFHSEEALLERASGLVCNLYRCDTQEQIIQRIELLGACSLFRLDATRTTRAWLSQAQFDETLRFFDSGLGKQHLNAYQILFFVGLREMARRLPYSVSIPNKIGDHILALWRANVSPNSNHQGLNAWMIEWLERCAKANWRLVKDNIPFPEPVVPILTAVEPNGVSPPQS